MVDIFKRLEQVSVIKLLAIWPTIILILVAIGYVIPTYFIAIAPKNIASTPEEKYYAEKVVEYRRKYLDEHEFRQPRFMRVISREQPATSKETMRGDKYCAAIPEAHFNEFYDKVYKYDYYTRGYTWFGLEDSGGDIVVGCALYKVGV